MSNKYGPKIVTDGLVLCLDAAYKKSYPGSGTTWYDSSGYDNHGTLTNGPTYNSENGGSIVLDGADDYIDFSSGVVDSSYTALTVEVWFNTLTSGTECLVENGSSYLLNSFYMFKENSTQLTFLVQSGAAYNVRFCSTTYSTNTWYHFVGVWSAGVSPNIYLNGVLKNGTLQGNAGGDGTISTLRDGNANLNLGRRPYLTGQYYFEGSIPSSRIYNRALSSAEILQNYNATKERYGI